MEEVRAALEESVRVARKLNGDFLLAVPLQYLGIVAFRRGEHEKAEAYLKEGLLPSVRCSGEEWLMANSLALLATLAASRGDHARATACTELPRL